MPRDDSYRSRTPEASVRKRKRSRSPTRTQHEHSSKPLPYEASTLSKHDLPHYRPLFALYLDIHKQLDVEELEENEVKGRWKSFINKWNHGDLAEGWYNPQTLTKAIRAQTTPSELQHSNQYPTEDAEEDDDFGPAPLPHLTPTSSRPIPTSGQLAAPTQPTTTDLRARDDQAFEDATNLSQQHRLNLQQARRTDRTLQRERLDDLVPRATAGTRDRQLEKKRDLALSHSSFAASAHDNSTIDLPDTEVMGSDTVGEFNRMKAENERKKNERELRKEEVLRARRAEREERLKVMREKEERTMEGLKELARANFG